MALHSLSTIKKLKDPLKQFQVKFTISDFPALKLARANSSVAGLLNKHKNNSFCDTEELELRCTSYSYPGTKIAQSEVIINDYRRKLGTIQNKSGVWTCKITEDQNGSVLNTIQNWCDLIHNPFNGLKLPSTTYVSTCVVEIESHVEGTGSRRSLWLKGFYPIEYNVGEIDASSSKPVEVTVKFNYDWWTETATSISALGV